MICLLGLICSRGQEALYLGRLSSECDPDVGCYFPDRLHLQSVEEWMRRSVVRSRQVSTYELNLILC